MKKIPTLLLILSSLFLYNCENTINNSEPIKEVSTNYSQSEMTPSFSPADIVIPTYNSFDKENSFNSICQNNNVVTLNAYSNNRNEYNDDYFNDSSDKYLEINKVEVPLEGVEVSFDNQKLFTGKDGLLNLSKKDLYKIKLTKPGYFPFETTIENSCLTYIGLSPLYLDELTAKPVEFKSYFVNPDSKSTDYPAFFTKDTKTGFGYYIVKSKEEFAKVKNLNFHSNDLDKIEKSIDEKKQILVLFIKDNYVFGSPPHPIDSVMESDNNMVLANHKGINLNVIEIENSGSKVTGDNFLIKIQGILIPYTDKKIKFIISESESIEVN